MRVTEPFARRATLSRSARLLAEFRFEQRDPARFYTALAADTAAMVGDLWRGCRRTVPAGETMLDVGGGAGYFASAFTDAGWHYIGVEPDPREMHAAERVRGPGPGTFVRASGLALPFRDHSVDVCLSSNVAEHVAQPWQLGAEMLRVTRPGGLVILSYGVARPVRRPRDGPDALPRRRPGGRPLHPQARPSAEEQLRVVTFAVSAADGLSWRRAPARWSPHFPLPPAMGVVADVGSRAARVRGEQSGAGDAALSSDEMNRF